MRNANTLEYKPLAQIHTRSAIAGTVVMHGRTSLGASTLALIGRALPRRREWVAAVMGTLAIAALTFVVLYAASFRVPVGG